jgi:hypothetical protein
MIKTFEQFVSAKYGKPINEAFQSSKLREIIKQHGMPKYSFENKMLYDLKDNEIIDVLPGDEFFSKYSSYEKRDEAVFSILLKDGYRVVISNLGILDDFMSEREKDKVFDKRYSERHKGEKHDKFGDIGYDQKQHYKNVENILRRRLVEKLQPSLPDIVKQIKSIMDDISVDDILEIIDGNFEDLSYKSHEEVIETEIHLNDKKYYAEINYTISCTDGVEKFGAKYYTVYYNLDNFSIYDDDDDITITNVDFAITQKTYAELFKDYVKKDVEGEITDHYARNGVKRSDFY